MRPEEAEKANTRNNAYNEHERIMLNTHTTQCMWHKRIVLRSLQGVLHKTNGALSARVLHISTKTGEHFRARWTMRMTRAMRGTTQRTCILGENRWSPLHPFSCKATLALALSVCFYFHFAVIVQFLCIWRSKTTSMSVSVRGRATISLVKCDFDATLCQKPEYTCLFTGLLLMSFFRPHQEPIEVQAEISTNAILWCSREQCSFSGRYPYLVRGFFLTLYWI